MEKNEFEISTLEFAKSQKIVLNKTKAQFETKIPYLGILCR